MKHTQAPFMTAPSSVMSGRASIRIRRQETRRRPELMKHPQAPIVTFRSCNVSRNKPTRCGLLQWLPHLVQRAKRNNAAAARGHDGLVLFRLNQPIGKPSGIGFHGLH